MADQGYITQAMATKTMAQGLGVKHNRFYTYQREGYVIDYVKQYLVDKYGVDTVRRGGLRIDTTIDLHLQKLARRAMDGQLGAPDRAGAIVTIDPKTGYVRAMASSSRYGDSKFNLAASGHRQAGSTFKVMVLMDALRRGVDPNRTTYVSKHLSPGWLPAAPSYEVQTYSHSYGGSMNLVKATLQSDNSVYAQLDADLGAESVAKTARDMGITSPLHGYPAEGLGGLTDGVSPLEMARAYASIANGGYRVQADRRAQGHLPQTATSTTSASRAAPRSSTTAWPTRRPRSSSKNVQAGTGTAAQIGCPAAGKTGTVDNYTDAWFVGFTPRLVTSVWVGHPKDPYPLGPGAAGGVVAAPIWGRYMKSAHGKFCGDFPQPKVPFVAQPFFGKYSRTGGQGQQRPTQQQPGATQPGTQPDPNGQGTTGKNGGGTKYPPDAYEAPPQTAPNTTQPPATPPAANSPPGAQDGGTGAPAPNPG